MAKRHAGLIVVGLIAALGCGTQAPPAPVQRPAPSINPQPIAPRETPAVEVPLEKPKNATPTAGESEKALAALKEYDSGASVKEDKGYIAVTINSASPALFNNLAQATSVKAVKIYSATNEHLSEIARVSILKIWSSRFPT